MLQSSENGSRERRSPTIGRKQDAKHSLMESVVLIQVANVLHCNSIESFTLGTSSEKATAANLQKYQGLKSYEGL